MLCSLARSEEPQVSADRDTRHLRLFLFHIVMALRIVWRELLKIVSAVK